MTGTTTLEGPPLDSVAGIGALTMGGFLEEVGERFADNEALVFDDPRRDGTTVRWTYARLLDEAHQIALGLRALGVNRGDRVGIVMGNRPEAVASLFAAALAGGVAVPLSTFAPKPELAYMLGQAEVVVALTQGPMLGRDYLADLRELQAELPALRHVIDLTAGPALSGATGTLPEMEEDDPALIIFSSGTTSSPKGVLHHHRAPTLQFWVQAQIFRRTEATRMWTALPMFWTAGLNTAMGSTLAAGGCWVMQETFEPGAALALMARERVTEPYTLPHQTGALEEHPDWATTDLSSLTCVFGKSAFARHPSVSGDTTWNMPVGYGLSEVCAFFSAHWSDAPREHMKASMGQLLPGNQLRVVDPDTGAALGAGQDGELAINGPTLFEGYLGVPREETFDADGFFHTGDAGFFDDEGFMHWTGRRTEMIKTGGANVSPAELEVQLRACPPVKLSRIIGMPDPRLDQLVVACIELKEGADSSEAEIQAFLRERVSAYKVPKRVLFFAPGEIPMTASDTKVRDEELASLVAHRLDPVPTTGD